MTQYLVSSIRYAFGGTHKIVVRDTVEGDELIRRDIELSTVPELELVDEGFDCVRTEGR